MREAFAVHAAALDERYLTVREVAERLRVHPKTVLRYFREAGLPGCRLPGGDIRFLWLDVSRWVASRKEVRP